MGGLWRRLPQTGIAFLIGALALGGFPGLSGFFSKDAIVDVAREHGILPYLAALAISALTAAYATRAFVRTFLGPANPAHIHPPGPVMLVPQWLLAILAVVVGYLPIQQFLIPVLGGEVVTINTRTAIVSTAVSLISAAVTYLLVSDPGRRRALLAGGAGLQRFLHYGMGLDALVDGLIVRPVYWIAGIAQPDVASTDASPSALWLRRPGVHRYVAGLVVGAFALAAYLLVQGW
jgi:NADH-quinone oxidoreductase subunit L